MMLVAGLGFVLEGDPGARQRVLDTALSQFPVVGDELQAGALTGSGVALVIGLVGALLGGLGVTLARADRVQPGARCAAPRASELRRALGCAAWRCSRCSARS